jgi:ABC-2 type transport system permease protein
MLEKKISRIIKILRAVAFVTYKEWAAYRSHMLVSLFVGPIYFIIQVFIWRALFEQTPIINGYSLEQMIAYFGIVTLLHYLIMDFADWNLQMLIRTGKFLTFMLRPVSHRFFAFSQKVGHRLLGIIWEFLPVYCIFFFVLKIRLVPEYPFWFALSALLSFLMMFLVNYSIGITGFWLIRTGGLRNLFFIMRSVFAGVFLPLTFFPVVLQKILFFLPFQFITYVPIKVFIGAYELAGMTLSIPQIVGIQALAVVFMWAVTELLWRMAIHKFAGVGA